MPKLLAVAIPILPGKTEQWKNFIGDLQKKYKKEFRASRKKLKIRERAFFQSTPHGDMVVIALEGSNPVKAFSKFGAAKDEFTEWFVEQVKEVHGFDLRQPPPGPLPELVLDSQ